MQVNIALLTVTDTRTIDSDKSGAILVKKIKEQNHNLIDRKIVKDEKKEIKNILLDWLKRKELDVIITTGGTGLTGRDITPEAIKEIADNLEKGNIDLTPETITLDWYEKLEKLNKKNSDLAINNKMLKFN